MFEPLIFSDLDGTLIFSASRKQPGDIVCEYKDNREISCITKRQAELLPGLEIIPVTTRSIEQYRRIRFPEGFSPEYALTDSAGERSSRPGLGKTHNAAGAGKLQGAGALPQRYGAGSRQEL